MLLPEGRNVPQSIRTRIILARCIISGPRMLAVEVYFYGMERKDRFLIAEVLAGKNQPWTMLTVTDDPILAAFCDRVIIMENGKILEEGTFEEIKRGPHYRKVFTAGEEVMELPKA